jgi:hypothetical protein
MTIITKECKPIERIVEDRKLDLSLFRKKSSAHTFQGWILSQMKKARSENNPDVAMLLQTCYKKFMEFQTSEKILMKRFKGDGDIQYFNKPDSVIVSYYQHLDEGEKAHEVKEEISKNDINRVILSINKLKDEKNRIPTKLIAEEIYKVKWSNFYGIRKEHILLTRILGILHHYGITHYSKRGFTTVLKPVREIQEILKWVS